MSRMHSSAKGQSGSKKPIKKIPSWMRYKEKELEKLIIKLAKSGNTPSEIGMILRDNYGIHSIKAIANKTINAILKENSLQKDIPEDLMALFRKLLKEKKHLEKNKHDQSARRGALLTDSKIRRLIKYYKKSGRMAKDWTFDPEKVKIYIE